MPVQTIEQTRLYRQIAVQIERLIRAGEFAPAERLPAERELARSLGVSRPSLREAMIALELAGLVEVRTGSGIYVTEPAQWRSAGRSAADEPEFGPFELLRARKVIEAENAALAAVERDEDDLRAMREAIDLMRHEATQPVPTEEGDRQFHLAIAAATRNAVLLKITEDLWNRGWRWRGGFWWDLTTRFYQPPKRRVDHAAVFKAIEARDARGARAAMRKHIAAVEAAFHAEGLVDSKDKGKQVA